MCVYVCMCVCVYVCMCVCVYVYVCVCMYIHGFLFLPASHRLLLEIVLQTASGILMFFCHDRFPFTFDSLSICSIAVTQTRKKLLIDWLGIVCANHFWWIWGMVVIPRYIYICVCVCVCGISHCHLLMITHHNARYFWYTSASFTSLRKIITSSRSIMDKRAMFHSYVEEPKGIFSIFVGKTSPLITRKVYY